MPRNKMRSNKMISGQNVETVSGRTLFTITTPTTTPISPASFSRAAAMADVFQFYRFVDLKVILVPGTTALVVGFAPGSGFDTPPTTNAAIVELPLASYLSGSRTVDMLLHIPRKELLKDAQLPWFKTIAGTPDTQFEVQGNLYSNSGSGVFIVEWKCEFQSWNLAAQSPFLKSPVSNRIGLNNLNSRPKQLLYGQATSDHGVSDSNANKEFVVVDGMTYYKSSA